MELQSHLDASRCPHCQVAKPTLSEVGKHETRNHAGTNERLWKVYKCSSCGGLVLAWAFKGSKSVVEHFPRGLAVDDTIPDRARTYLKQACECLHAPAGSVMLAASCVDSMLKEKGYTTGSLNSRIDAAAKAHDITDAMAQWAHEVRLDANDQRHADIDAILPTEEDAKRAIEFTKALAQYLFVLPARVSRGMSESGPAK